MIDRGMILCVEHTRNTERVGWLNVYSFFTIFLPSFNNNLPKENKELVHSQLTTWHVIQSHSLGYKHIDNSTQICRLNFFYYCTHVTKDLHLGGRLQYSWVHSTPPEIKSSDSQGKTQLAFLSSNREGLRNPILKLCKNQLAVWSQWSTDLFIQSLLHDMSQTTTQLSFSINNETPSLMPISTQSI